MYLKKRLFNCMQVIIILLFGSNTNLSGSVNVLQSGQLTLQDDVLVNSAVKMEDLYRTVQADVVNLQQEMIKKLQYQITLMPKKYSQKSSDECIKYLDDMMIGFRHQIKVIQTVAVADYYNFVQKQDLQFTYAGTLTKEEKLFIHGIEFITQEAIVKMQGFVLDITSQNLKSRMGLDLQQGFYDSSIQAQSAYKKQKAYNEKRLNRSWWEKIKNDALGLLCREFTTQYELAIKKEVVKQTQMLIEDVGGEIAVSITKRATGVAGNNINPVLVSAIEGLSGTLKDESLSYLFSSESTAALTALKKTIRDSNHAIVASKPSMVAATKDLSVAEKEFLKNRMVKVQKVLQEKFGIAAPLRIAFCCSGGGNRAMIGTIGLFMAASKYSLLQASVYCAGLSGSTWAILPWSYMYLKENIATRDFEKSLVAVRRSLEQSLSDSAMIDPSRKGMFLPPMLGADVKSVFSHQIMTWFGYDQPISMVNIWGALIGNFALKLVGSRRLQVKLSELYTVAQKGDIPLSLCSSVIAKDDDPVSGDLYDWFEMSPFQVGSNVLGYVKPEEFGGTFKDGMLLKGTKYVEAPISYLLGVFGSAFSVSLSDIFEKGLPSPTVDVLGYPVTVPVSEIVKKMIDDNYADVVSSKKRGNFMYAQFDNYSAGLKHSLLKNKDFIGLIDGGLAFNFPLPLLMDRSQRAVDIIIMYDSNPGDVASLKTADLYFKRKNILMPTMGNVSQADVMAKNMTVFNDPRNKAKYSSKMPTILYFPTKIDVRHSPYVSTNFKYTQRDIQTLISLVMNSFESQVASIQDIMQLIAKARHS